MTKIKNTTVSRFNNFQAVLNIPVGSEIDFKTISDSEIESHFEKYNFVKQVDLETILLNLKIKSKATLAILSDFRGQLERGTSEGRPHWQLYLCTSKQTVKTEVLKALSMALYSVENHSSIQVTVVQDVESSIEYVTKEERLDLSEDSPWSPGIISMTAAKFRQELIEDPILGKILKGMARKYQRYLLNIINGKPNDRLIYWVMDFAGKTGKSKFTRSLEKASIAITASIDHPRPFAKNIILNAQNYYAKHDKDPQAVIIDLSRQVPQEYLSGFYGVLESLKNGKLTSMFQSMSEYSWKHPPHVIVFANQPPQSNALSADRLVLLEILNEDYDYAIRHAKCSTTIIKRTNKFVSYHYVSQQATNQDIRKLTKTKHFIFTDEELAYQQIKHKDPEQAYCSVSLYQGISETIYANDGGIPQNVMSLVMDYDEENEKTKKKY
jgi:hypothetical protein